LRRVMSVAVAMSVVPCEGLQEEGGRAVERAARVACYISCSP
jgi:hypothetical protein